LENSQGILSLQYRLFLSLCLSVLAPLTGDAPHAKNIWAEISIDVYAKSVEADCVNKVIGEVIFWEADHEK
jgi:hypothetical protein